MLLTQVVFMSPASLCFGDREVCVCRQHTRIYWRDFPGSLVVKIPWSHCRRPRAQIWSLVRELGSHAPWQKKKRLYWNLGRGPYSQWCILIFLLSLSLVHPWEKKKNGPYEGKMLVAKRRCAKTSVMAQWPPREGSVSTQCSWSPALNSIW